MPALVTESPDYAEKVTACLARNGRRRLPWGTIIAGGTTTLTKTTREVAARHEMGETAIALLVGLGVTEEMIDKLTDLPWTTTPAELAKALEAAMMQPTDVIAEMHGHPGKACWLGCCDESNEEPNATAP